MFGNSKMSNHSLFSNHSYIYSPRQMCEPGWQKLCEGTKGIRWTVWTRTKILSPNIRYFVAMLRFVVIYTLFGRLCARKGPFWVKTVFLGQKVHYYKVYLAYYTELNVQICNYAQKQRICRKNIKFDGHFCPRRKAANFCHRGVRKVFQVVLICILRRT